MTIINPGIVHLSTLLSSILVLANVLLLVARNSPAATAKSLQSCPTLCDPIDGSPPGSPVPGILQARTLEWVAISFSNAGKWKVKVKLLSRIWLVATPWTTAYQAPPSMGFSRQEYWSGVPLPSPRNSPRYRIQTCNIQQRGRVFPSMHLFLMWGSLFLEQASPLVYISPISPKDQVSPWPRNWDHHD